jgi:hypothetical protein
VYESILQTAISSWLERAVAVAEKLPLNEVVFAPDGSFSMLRQNVEHVRRRFADGDTPATQLLIESHPDSPMDAGVWGIFVWNKGQEDFKLFAKQGLVPTSPPRWDRLGEKASGGQAQLYGEFTRLNIGVPWYGPVHILDLQHVLFHYLTAAGAISMPPSFPDEAASSE